MSETQDAVARARRELLRRIDDEEELRKIPTPQLLRIITVLEKNEEPDDPAADDPPATATTPNLEGLPPGRAAELERALSDGAGTMASHEASREGELGGS